MPGRCNCPGSTCGCTIQAGPGIRVDGTGTVGSPFLVGLDSVAATINHTSVGSLDLSAYIGDSMVTVSLSSNVTGITLPESPGARVELALVQTVAGRTVSWPSAIKWVGGSAPTLSTVAGRTDWIQLRQISEAVWLGASIGIGLT